MVKAGVGKSALDIIAKAGCFDCFINKEKFAKTLEKGLREFEKVSNNNPKVFNILKSKNKTQDILIRITPGIECHTHKYIQTGHLDSKFGFDLAQIDEVIETYH